MLRDSISFRVVGFGEFEFNSRFAACVPRFTPVENLYYDVFIAFETLIQSPSLSLPTLGHSDWYENFSRGISGVNLRIDERRKKVRRVKMNVSIRNSSNNW